MHYAFQDKVNLYLVMDYLGAGDLRHHIIKNKRFSEEKLSKIYFHIKNKTYTIFRIHNCLHTDCSRIHSRKKYIAS